MAANALNQEVQVIVDVRDDGGNGGHISTSQNDDQTYTDALNTRPNQTSNTTNSMNMLNRRISLTLLLALVLSTVSFAQSRNRNQPAPPPPTGPVTVPSDVQFEFIKTYDLNRINSILNDELTAFMSSATMKAAEFDGQIPKATYPVNLYRVRYRTVVPEMGNKPVMATGLIAIPDKGIAGAQTLPVVSYQHGSVFHRDEIPSIIENSIEARLVVSTFATQGYVVIAADYIGMGDSELPASYFMMESTQQAMLDMYMAGKDVLASKSITMSDFFIFGWSQGGWNTMAFLKKLESIGQNPTAAATAAAPSDMLLSVLSAIQYPRDIDAIWAPYFHVETMRAKEYYFSLPGLTASMVKEDYLEAQNKARNKEMSLEEFFSTTPTRISSVLKPEFFEESKKGTGIYLDYLRAMDVYRWSIQTPLINYFGHKDEVVTVYNATQIANYSNQLGSTVKAVSAGDNADHRSTFVYAMIHGKAMFDSFVNK